METNRAMSRKENLAEKGGDVTMEQNKTKVLSPMMELVLCMTAWAQETQNSVQSAHYPIDTVKRMAFLRKVGLTNTTNANEIKAYANNAALLQFMCRMWNDLGHNTLLVRTQDFYKILCKHDLMCGDFTRYKGEIPEKNMQEIETVIEAYEGGLMGSYADPIKYAAEIRLSYTYDGQSFRYSIDEARMPFVGTLLSTDKGTMAFHLDAPSHNSLLQYPFFIAAPRQQMRDIPIYAESRGWSLRPMPTYVTKSYLHFDEKGEAEVAYNTDPFVCSLCEHGVIIHSMWGAEAEDAIIKRYEQLRDAIMEKGDAL